MIKRQVPRKNEAMPTWEIAIVAFIIMVEYLLLSDIVWLNISHNGWRFCENVVT